MLRSLDIRDILIIDRLRLEFRPGLNVLTGETGAGKSILLDALGLVLGWRGRADVVRQGATQGEVEAVFDLPAALRPVLSDAGLSSDDPDLVLRRVVAADGRKTGYVNDRRAGTDLLRALGEGLVELHGQHDDRGLLNPRGHRLLLDAFAGIDTGPVRAAWTAWQQARRALDDGTATLDAARREEDFLRHAVAELDRLAPEPGEDAVLDTRRRAIQASQRVAGDIARAAQALGDEGAEHLLADAARWLEGAAARLPEGASLDPALAALSRAMAELAEAQSAVQSTAEALDFDPAEAERVEERLFALRALARKHSVPPDDLGALADDLRARLAALDGGVADLAARAQAVDRAAAVHAAMSGDLTAGRAGAAARLDTAMARELPALKLDRARFVTEVTPADPGPEGADAVSFTVATNPGAPQGALDRIASGGELSRFLLALKVCLAGDEPGQTMIFDEIDRGVGGATAAAVGRRLARLSQSAQVLVVTHSPQVAALGAHHWRVEKRVAGGATLSTVVPLDSAARVEEIARMLAGDQITDAARAAAWELLQA